MSLVALTGGIASGKSTIARRLAEHGAVIVDADAIVRQVQRPGSPVLDAIAAAFGGQVIAADGNLDRPALAAVVFADADARARLNAIVHPAVGEESARRFAAAFAADPAAVVVYDVPLLAEARAHDPWDLVVVADAPPDVRVERLVALRGLTREDAAARIAAQVDDAVRRAMADVVIDTSGAVEHTLAQTDALWRRIVPGALEEVHRSTGAGVEVQPIGVQREGFSPRGRTRGDSGGADAVAAAGRRRRRGR